ISGPNAMGVFTISGCHAYADEDNVASAIKVQILHGGTTSNSISTALQLTDPAVVGTPVSISIPAGAPFLGTLATFTDPGGAEPISGSHYSATLNWGDS